MQQSDNREGEMVMKGETRDSKGDIKKPCL